MRNSSNSILAAFRAFFSARIFFVYSCPVFCLLPSFAVAENGALGATSVGRVRISIVIPEQMESTGIHLDDGKLVTCGSFSPGLSYISVSDGSVTPLFEIASASSCSGGQTFLVPTVSGSTAVLIPSSAS